MTWRCRFELSSSVRDRIVKIEFVRENRGGLWTTVMQEIKQEYPRFQDKYCENCHKVTSLRDYSTTISCTCRDNFREPESAIRQMSFTHYEKLTEGDSIYLKAVSGEAYIGGKSKFMFSGEFISE